MTYDQPDDLEIPRQVRTARILLFVGAALTALVILTTPLVVDITAESVGYLAWVSWPGVAAFVIALKLPRGGRRLFWITMGVCGYWALGSLATLGQGNPRGVTQLIIPVGVIVLLTRPPAKAFLS